MRFSWLKYAAILLACMTLSAACGNKKRVAKVNKGTNSPAAPAASNKTVQQCQAERKILMDGKCVAETACTAPRTVREGQCLPPQASANTAPPAPQARPESVSMTQQLCSGSHLVIWNGSKCVCASSGLEIRQMSEADKCRAPGTTVDTAGAQAQAALNKANAAGKVEAPASYMAVTDGILKAGAQASATAETLKVLGVDLKVQHAPLGNSLSLLYGRAVLTNGGTDRLVVEWEGKNIDTANPAPVTLATKEALVVKARCASEKCDKFAIFFELKQGGSSQQAIKYGSVPSAHDGDTKLYNDQQLSQPVPSTRNIQ